MLSEGYSFFLFFFCFVQLSFLVNTNEEHKRFLYQKDFFCEIIKQRSTPTEEASEINYRPPRTLFLLATSGRDYAILAAQQFSVTTARRKQNCFYSIVATFHSN